MAKARLEGEGTVSTEAEKVDAEDVIPHQGLRFQSDALFRKLVPPHPTPNPRTSAPLRLRSRKQDLTPCGL